MSLYGDGRTIPMFDGCRTKEVKIAKMFATGPAVAGIIIDATVIRALIVPAVTSLMGRPTGRLPENR